MRTLNPELLELQAHPDALATVTVRCKRRSTFAGDPLLWRPAFKHTSGNVPYGDVNVTAAACSSIASREKAAGLLSFSPRSRKRPPNQPRFKVSLSFQTGFHKDNPPSRVVSYG